jgi:hypothetical protein
VITLLVGVGLVALVAIAGGIGLGLRRRALARERHRLDALTDLEDRFRSATASLDAQGPANDPLPTPAPVSSASGSRGRAALLDALTGAVTDARSEGSRLSVARIESSETTAAVLAARVAEVTRLEPYEVGARAVALVVRAGGRAEALGVLARIQAACGARGDAVELEPGESAVELLARALSSAPPAA